MRHREVASKQVAVPRIFAFPSRLHPHVPREPGTPYTDEREKQNLALPISITERGTHHGNCDEP
ncbi:Uncharacterised protein [Mycobacteroides abscessus subsp. massiliense]|nr:Uncharacterised protein [Mycobacteroides abscessus subsp. massiliense]